MNPSPGFSDAPRVNAVPLLHGDAGTAQTIGLARKLVENAIRDERINAFAVSLVRNTPNHDDLSKVQQIFEWVLANISYVMDPVGPDGAKEVLRNAIDTIRLGAGDCDDINAVLFPALYGSVGYSTRIVTVAVDPSNPEQYSHVYCEVDVNGEWVPCDAARPGAQFGLAPRRYFKKKIWPMTDSMQAGIFGFRRRALNGLAQLNGTTLGDGTDYADIIRASGSAAAQVISAADQNPYSFQSFSNSQYQTPYNSFGQQGPQLGYGVTGTAQLTGGGSWLPIAGIVLLFLVLKK